jgi:hypothetical protein
MAEELNKFETFKTLGDYESNLKSAQKAKKDLDTDIETVNDALNTNITSFTFKGKKYTLSALRDLLATLKGDKEETQNNVEIANNRFKEAKKDNSRALKLVDAKLEQAENNLDLAKFQFQKGSIDEAARNQAFSAVSKINDDKKRIKENGELAVVAAGVPGAAATYAFKADIGMSTATATQPGFTTSQVGTLLSTSGPGIVATGTKPAADATDTETDDTGDGAPGAAVVPTAPVVDVAKRKAFVSAQLTARGLENTPENREMLRKEYKTAAVAGKTPETGAVSNAWETIIREQFPAKAWLLDLDRAKYPQLFKVLSTAIAEESYKTPEGRARFEAQLEGTEFYKEISQSKQLKTIQSLVGTLGFEGSDFTKFVSDSINFGYDGDILKQKVYEQVFAKDDAGNYINPTALERVKESAGYISTQNIAKAFFNTNPADDDIEQRSNRKNISQPTTNANKE